MKKILIKLLLIQVLSLLMIACAGDDELSKDTKPPTKPVMIPHLGDTGDGSVLYNENEIILNDSNNGIDAEANERGIRLLWEPLIYDNDLDKIIINRYMNDHVYASTKIDSITADNNYYIDNSIPPESIYENKFSYFIQVLDKAGNSTLSDTVHYRLTDKAFLNQPLNGQVLANSDSIRFDWTYTGYYDFLRILLFDQGNNLLWVKDIDPDASDPDNSAESGVEYSGSQLASGTYYWRIDVFKFDYELNEFYNYDNLFYYGSESLFSEFSIEESKK